MNTSVPSLVTIENNVPLADSREIAKELGIEHRSFFKMILEYQQEIEEDFGQLRFEIAVKSGNRGGAQPKYALLTEDQTYAYLAYSQNTPQARTCKRTLVKAFAEARKRLQTLTASQLEPLYLDATYVALLKRKGLTPRCIRMVSYMAMEIDIREAIGNNPLTQYLFDQWEAEADAMTPEDEQWGRTSRVTTRRFHRLK